MNTNFKSKMFFVAIVAIMFFGRVAKAQCSYVLTDSAGRVTSTRVPCDFPVMINTGNYTTDKSTFEAAKTSWLTVNPGLNMVVDVPNTTKIFHIEIPNAVFQNFAADKKSVIQSIPFYYYITH